MPPSQERAIIVGVDFTGRSRSAPGPSAQTVLDAEESLQELRVLAESAGAEIVTEILQSRPAPDSATLIGSGKVQEIREMAEAHEIDSVVFDRELSPTQLRNLERSLHTKVLDRTQLILDIFASRARTREGQLQVELAQLNYLLPRLAGRGTQMSRLGGGIGTRGPGETQLETDRRRIGRRITKLKADLERVRRSRGTQRSQREAVPLSTVGLVGYTNAGKSTLFNRLTGADVVADARMFATLDPTVRHVILPSQRRVLLSDTVGFIRNLPTTLVNAFRATLEEVTAAALLLHVVDVTSSTAEEYTKHVLHVLSEIGAERTPQILVLNKADLLVQEEETPDLATLTHRILGETARQNQTEAVLVSAQSGQGIDNLLGLIDQKLDQDPIQRQRFRFPLSAGAALHSLHERAVILSQTYTSDFCEVEADAPLSIRNRLAAFAVE